MLAYLKIQEQKTHNCKKSKSSANAVLSTAALLLSARKREKQRSVYDIYPWENCTAVYSL